MKKNILSSLEDGIRAVRFLTSDEGVGFIEGVADLLVRCFMKQGKVLIAGNGGSLCDAMHFAEELTGLYREKRPPLAAIALSDPGHMSCVANDLGYEFVFSRTVEALGRPGDVFIAMTTSGNSLNLIRAFEKAAAAGMHTVAFLGKNGGKMKGMFDMELIVDEGFVYSDRIQEAHMTAVHVLIEIVEKKMASYWHTAGDCCLGLS